MNNPNRLTLIKLFKILNEGKETPECEKALKNVIMRIAEDEISLEDLKTEVRNIGTSLVLDDATRDAYQNVWMWMDD